MNEFLILFRETLEVSLVVGIIATTVVRAGKPEALGAVALGLGAALVASLLLGFAFYFFVDSVGSYFPLYEAVMLYTASGMLLYMVVWMARHSRGMAREMSDLARSRVEDGQYGLIAVMVFVATIREGAETVMFLFGLVSMSGGFSILASLAGMASAVAIGYYMFARGKQLPLKQFFTVSSVLLILFSAGMAAYGTHEVEEFLADNGYINENFVARPYSIFEPSPQEPTTAAFLYTESDGTYTHFLHDKGLIGSVLKALFGYNSNPNWAEFGLYFLVIIGGISLWRRSTK